MSCLGTVSPAPRPVLCYDGSILWCCIQFAGRHIAAYVHAAVKLRMQTKLLTLT